MFDKDDQDISQIIDASLEAVLSGKATLEQALAEHPQQADVLRREIEAAMWLVSRREQVSARPGFVASSRKRVVARIKEEASNTGAKRSIFGFVWPQKIAYQWVAALMAFILLFSGAGGVVSYAQTSMPGESLYPIKLATEKLQFSLTADELERIQVSANFTNRRLQEVITLVQQGKLEAAVNTIQNFEEQITETVVLLEESSDQQAHEKKVLANDLRADFTNKVDKLETLKEQAPQEVHPELDRAKALTELSASAALDEAASIFDPTETPTPTPTITPTGTSTTTTTPTATGTSTKTPVPPVPAGGTEPGEEDGDETDAVNTDEPEDPDKKPSKTPKPSFTPKVMPSQATPGRPIEEPPQPPPKEEDKPTKPPKENSGQGQSSDN